MIVSQGLTRVLAVQGAYYVVTGLWPLLDVSSFEAVVGPKPDIFQLHVTSALVLASGTVLLLGSRQPDTGTVRVSILSALALLALEVAYARTLRWAFWIDGGIELALALAVGGLWRSRFRRAR